jgi:hypothetical protein
MHSPVDLFSRRSRFSTPIRRAALTDDQIAEVMARAVALRRRTARNPADVEAQPLSACDAIAMTENWRLHTRRSRFRYGADAGADPWYWIGWVGQETPAGCIERFGGPCSHQAWAVWLNVGDGRVWLKLERHGRWTEPGDPYP